jgi:hypothetical protein
MKIDPAMINAVMNMAKRQYDHNASPDARTLGAFAANVLLPLMTERANSHAYKSARRGLIDRGRNPNEHG